MVIFGILLVIAVSILWYKPGIWAQGKNRTLQTKDYLKAVLIYGFLYCCLLIMATEVLWDMTIGRPKDADFAGKILSDFFRAALLEEFFKLTGFLLAKRKLKPQRKIDYVMIAGLMGLAFNIVERAALGRFVAMIFGIVFPMHILWQFNQGGHYFEYEKAKAEGNKQLAHREWFLAVCIPFLLHALWDSAMDVVGYLTAEEKSVTLQVIGYMLLAAAIILAVIYTVKTIIKVCRIAKEDSAVVAVEEN